MKASIVYLAATAALASCSAIVSGIGHAVHCPTLWLQVEKTEPAPWPEVPREIALPPQTPAGMQNRFDVIAKPPGTRALFAQEYADRFDPRDDVTAARTKALGGLQRILDYYKDEIPCTGPEMTGTLNCDDAEEKGEAGGCNVLAAPTLSTPQFEAVKVNGRYHLVRSIDAQDSTGNFGVNLTTSVDLGDGDPVTFCAVSEFRYSRTLLSFVHLSDIQIRDPSVVLTDRAVSRRLDWFTALHSFEYDEDLMFYNQYLAEAMVATINAAHTTTTDPEEPSFAIHTGDSIDSNAMSELVRFHKVIDRLAIPFYEVFGNHDVLVFGNLTPTADPKSDATCTPVSALIGAESSFVPDKLCVEERMRRCPTCSAKEAEFVATSLGAAQTRERFMKVLDHASFDQVPQVPPNPNTEAYCAKPYPGVSSDAHTRAHGFDMNTATGRADARVDERLVVAVQHAAL